MKDLFNVIMAGLIICYSGITSLAQEPTTKSISGTVKSIGLEKKEFVLESIDTDTGNTSETTIKVDDTTEIEYGLVLDDIIEGDEMSVEYITNETQDKVAKSIKFIEEESEESEVIEIEK